MPLAQVYTVPTSRLLPSLRAWHCGNTAQISRSQQPCGCSRSKRQFVVQAREDGVSNTTPCKQNNKFCSCYFEWYSVRRSLALGIRPPGRLARALERNLLATLIQLTSLCRHSRSYFDCPQSLAKTVAPRLLELQGP